MAGQSGRAFDALVLHLIGDGLDNQDVCRLLDISPSKLITLRRSGAVAYSRIDRKIFYKREDIRKFIERELQKQGKA